MSGPLQAIYEGIVVHRRLRPVAHELRYKVGYLLLDVDEIAATGSKLRLFSYNRANLFSIRDRDYGPGDGTPIAEHARRTVAHAGLEGEIERIYLLTMPRTCGYAFNPLSIYYGVDAGGDVRLVVYEVSNTFGERKSYVLPVGEAPGGRIRQNCAKRLYVSPFNDERGRYDFSGAAPGERVRLTIGLSTEEGPLLTAHVVARRAALDDRGLFRLFLRYPALTWKVIGGIHLEAFRLWRKGLRVRSRPPGPDVPVTYLPSPFEMERR